MPIPEIETRRDQLAVLLDPVRRLKRPDILRVTEVLKRGAAAILIGPARAYVRQQRFTEGQTVLFWHTGGQVGLFA